MQKQSPEAQKHSPLKPCFVAVFLNGQNNEPTKLNTPPESSYVEIFPVFMLLDWNSHDVEEQAEQCRGMFGVCR